jgi:hypothetical protein
MAHEIRSNDSLVLARTSAWHGLGQILPDTVTPAEALTIGRLNWTVEESTSLTATFVANDGNAERAIIDTHKSLRRSDDQSILSTVGADYSVLQNSTLAEIATSLGSQGSAAVRRLCNGEGLARELLLLRLRARLEVALQPDDRRLHREDLGDDVLAHCVHLAGQCLGALRDRGGRRARHERRRIR